MSFRAAPRNRRAARGSFHGRVHRACGSTSQTALLAIVWVTSLLLAGGLGYVLGKNASSLEDAPSDAQAAPAQQAGDTQVATKAQSKESPAEKSPEAQLREDVQRAISLLDDGRLAIFLQDYLSRRDLARMNGQIEAMAQQAQPREIEQLRENLVASLEGEISLSQDEQLAEVTYVLKAQEFIPESVPEPTAQPGGRLPSEELRELGGELPEFLTRAAALLREERLEEFIAGTYPLATLAELGMDGVEQMAFRVRSASQMSAAMLRDLEAAAEAEGELNASGNEATVVLPPLVEGDPQRILKFDKVDGHWRFHDADRDIRDEYQRLLAAPLPAFTIPGAEGVIRFERDGDHWRISEPPQDRPLVE